MLGSFVNANETSFSRCGVDSFLNRHSCSRMIGLAVPVTYLSLAACHRNEGDCRHSCGQSAAERSEGYEVIGHHG